MMWNDGYDGITGWPLMGAVMVLVWSVLLVGLVLALRWGRDSGAPAPDPRGILDERLARGEISVEEHAQRVEALATRASVAHHR